MLEFWVRLFSGVEPKDIQMDRMTEKMMDSMTDRLPIDRNLYRSHIQPEVNTIRSCIIYVTNNLNAS